MYRRLKKSIPNTQMAHSCIGSNLSVDCIYSWGSAVLAATYEGLSKICITTGLSMPKVRTLTGCPLLLNLFVYERFIELRPRLKNAYNYSTPDNMDGDTMVSRWCRSEVHKKNLNPTIIPVKNSCLQVHFPLVLSFLTPPTNRLHLLYAA